MFAFLGLAFISVLVQLRFYHGHTQVDHTNRKIASNDDRTPLWTARPMHLA
jgi:hypothetical protein